MTSYKIHSIKNSEKLSFIIEWDSESSVTQKLSSEGHIIHSAEKVETTLWNLFCFEGKKAEGGFIDGKISADDIFIAYEMLTQEYQYSLTKLYPENITDPKKQEKIFTELRASFQEGVIQKPKQQTDTAKQQVTRYKKILKQLVEILQKDPEKQENAITELKKLEQNSNTIAIQQTIKDILKKISNDRKNPIFKEIKPIMKDMGMFVAPDFYFTISEKIAKISQSLSPLFHPSEVHVQRVAVDQAVSQEVVQKEYESIQNNNHIHTFLRKKYRPKTSEILKSETKKYYLYTLFREKKSLFLSKKVIKNLQKIATTALIIMIFITCLAIFLWLYSTLFVTTNAIVIFGALIVLSLVIQSETV